MARKSQECETPERWRGRIARAFRSDAIFERSKTVRLNESGVAQSEKFYRDKFLLRLDSEINEHARGDSLMRGDEKCSAEKRIRRSPRSYLL